MRRLPKWGWLGLILVPILYIVGHYYNIEINLSWYLLTFILGFVIFYLDTRREEELQGITD